MIPCWDRIMFVESVSNNSTIESISRCSNSVASNPQGSSLARPKSAIASSSSILWVTGCCISSSVVVIVPSSPSSSKRLLIAVYSSTKPSTSNFVKSIPDLVTLVYTSNNSDSKTSPSVIISCNSRHCCSSSIPTNPSALARATNNISGDKPSPSIILNDAVSASTLEFVASILSISFSLSLSMSSSNCATYSSSISSSSNAKRSSSATLKLRKPSTSNLSSDTFDLFVVAHNS